MGSADGESQPDRDGGGGSWALGERQGPQPTPTLLVCHPRGHSGQEGEGEEVQPLHQEEVRERERESPQTHIAEQEHKDAVWPGSEMR